MIRITKIGIGGKVENGQRLADPRGGINSFTNWIKTAHQSPMEVPASYSQLETLFEAVCRESKVFGYTPDSHELFLMTMEVQDLNALPNAHRSKTPKNFHLCLKIDEDHRIPKQLRYHRV
jgi:hypothetical protein